MAEGLDEGNTKVRSARAFRRRISRRGGRARFVEGVA